ncbi:NADH dehydrogenase [ubiquinone] iron-sulfur protein 7 mitochondrial, partial [Dissostichus eleginoides]
EHYLANPRNSTNEPGSQISCSIIAARIHQKPTVKNESVSARCDETVNGAGLDGRLLCSAVCGMERFGTERFGIYRRPGEDG